MTSLSVLVVQHEASSPAAWLGDVLEAEGLALSVWRPYDGEPPVSLEGAAGLLVLGGAMDSWDDEASPWLPHVRHLVRGAESRGAPTLGVCLGHQVAAAALGGRVERNPAGTTVDVLPLGWCPAAAHDPLLGGACATRWGVHWNSDVVTALPDGARVLAEAPDGHPQAVRLGEHVWGVQYHPEAGPDVVRGWVADEAEATGAGRRSELDDFVHRVAEAEPMLRAGCTAVGTAFAALVREAR